MDHETEALTVARVLRDEKRGVRWAQEAIARTLENLQMALQELHGDEQRETRTAILRTQANLRDVHYDLRRASEQLVEASLVADRSVTVVVQDERLIARKARRQNGADSVRNARKDREERAASFAERERQRRERERRAFLDGRTGEGMRDNQD